MLAGLPEVDLRHILTLTDDTGILQHSSSATPNPWHGYCTDDNARAAIAAVLHGELFGQEETLLQLQRYLSFMMYAFDPGTGRFRNFMGYDRRWVEGAGSEDSQSRAIWALGVTVHRARNDSDSEMANRLFHDALPAAEKFAHVRPWAYIVLGLHEHLASTKADDRASELLARVADLLLDSWRAHATGEWPWWEDVLTWGNARLPHALIECGVGLGRKDMTDAGLRALRWLIDLQTVRDDEDDTGHLSIIGNNGWYVRGGRRATYDQQPLEAHALVDACLAAADFTGEDQWLDRAKMSFEWFLGRNDKRVPLRDEETGGCRDGLMADGVNSNEGAESTLAYVLSLLDILAYRQEHQAAAE